jgi:Secretion system C-terminal sorting domain
MKKIFTICLLAFLGTKQVNAQCIEEASLSYNYGSNYYQCGYGQQSGQSFTASCSGNLTSITIKTGSPSDVNGISLELYAGNSNFNTPIAVSNTFTAPGVGGPNLLVDVVVTFPTPVAVTAGNVYTFVGSDPGNGFYALAVTTDIYAVGNALRFLSNDQMRLSAPQQPMDDVWAQHANNSLVAGMSNQRIAAGSILEQAYTVDLLFKVNIGSGGCPINSLPSITGATALCIGGSASLSNTQAGGVWVSNNNRATVNATTGVVTGVNAGTASISYKYTTGGCKLTTTSSFAVNSLPSVPSFYYAAGTPNPQKGAGGAFCTNKTFTMVGTPSGGMWSSTGVITVDASTGVVNTGSSAGAATLKYTYTNTNGCSNSRTITGTVAACAARGVNGIENGKWKMENDFTIFPNPAKTFIRLNVETLMGAGSIVVTDLYGKQVKAQSLSIGTNTVDIANLAKAIYFVSTVTIEGKTTKKLVVE